MNKILDLSVINKETCPCILKEYFFTFLLALAIGVIITMIPPLLVFIVMQESFMRGFALQSDK